MSIVKETIRSLNLNKVPERLALYEQLVQNAEPLFQLSGKGLEETCKEHAQNLMMYDLMLQECKTIEETIRAKMEEVEGELYQKYQTGPRALSTTDIKNYIKGDPRYVNAFEILLEVSHSKRQLEAVVEALKSMGWSINNIVKIRVAELSHVTL
jgi:hypothetical protein